MQTNSILLLDKDLNRIQLIVPIVNLINKEGIGKDIASRSEMIRHYVQTLVEHELIHTYDVQQVIKSAYQLMVRIEEQNRLRGISYESLDSYKVPVSSDVSPFGDNYEDM